MKRTMVQRAPRVALEFTFGTSDMVAKFIFNGTPVLELRGTVDEVAELVAAAPVAFGAIELETTSVQGT